ncbi:hypothetical protein Gorai_006535 [Gossypium raimondii]|uniref:Uncharacterized protein n=1 Tax=Gossypium raimondii TaxID=29730 RepID=A0A7J8QFN3_GOSRA|nr:hypothetical protein [Gossypium raimondii]
MHLPFREIPNGGKTQKSSSQRGSRTAPLISKVKISNSTHLVSEEGDVLG